MARTKAIGFPRGPPPPMPPGLPPPGGRLPARRCRGSCRSGWTRPPRRGWSACRSRLFPPGRAGERVAVFVRYPSEVEFERKALLHAVTGIHPLHIDEVERFL